MKGVDLFTGPLRPVSTIIPANSIFVLGTGGRGADRTHQDGATRYPTVQVRIRNSSLPVGAAKAEEVYQALSEKPITGFEDCAGVQSAPIYLAQDENGRYHWSLNFELMGG